MGNLVQSELSRLYSRLQDLEREVRARAAHPGGGGGWRMPGDKTGLAIGDTIFKFTAADVVVNSHRWLCCNLLDSGNVRTVGDASSSATAWASAAAADIFAYLWTNISDTYCPVSGGRGASAVADFGAHKRIALPDWRDRYPVGKGYIQTVAGGTDALADDLRSPKSHTHEHAITTATERAHTHGIGGNTGSGGGHSHTIAAETYLVSEEAVGDATGGDWGLWYDATSRHHSHYLEETTTDAVAAHTHSLPANSGTGSAHNHTVGGTITAATPWPPHLTTCMFILAEVP